MGSKSGFLSQKLYSLIHAVTLFLIPISSSVSRLHKFVFFSKKNDIEMILLEAKKDGDKSELHLKFKFPTFEEFSRIQKGRDDPEELGLAFSRRSVSAFIEVLTTFTQKEINGDKYGELSELFSSRKLVKVDEEIECAEQRGGEVTVGNGKVDNTQEFLENKVDSIDESEFFSERSSDGLLSDGDFGDSEDEVEGLESGISSVGENKENPQSLADGVGEIKNADDEQKSGFSCDGDYGEVLDFDSENEGVGLESQTPSLGENKENLQPLLCEIKKVEENEGQKYLNVNSEKKNGDGFVCGDANKLESLWEHQELIEQLQMELRKVKATGPPTILEESESPKIIDDLKPWKKDENEKLQHEDRMVELHKLYKSYREMMRKFDILNYQKMYAMGFLQLKDPFQATAQQKPDPAPMLKYLVSKNLWLFKHKKRGTKPVKKLINELQGDLEAVYVGQMCLSWEFLHWQYEKALDLWNSDPHGVHRYNEVAGEFQQFQVLVQRFTEDEPFQGQRVQSYVKSRCVLRNLLQVPVIKGENYFHFIKCVKLTLENLGLLAEDCLGSRTEDMDEYAITSEMLVDMLEESIRIFWKFVRSDKDCTIASTKLLEPHSPEDNKLLIELRKNLQKKTERKLKEIVRSESCILRKFQKRREKEEDSDQALHFFAQVDVKLVCRVLNMSRISREQLIWCQNKLSRISIVNRKVCAQPAFLPFPC